LFLNFAEEIPGREPKFSISKDGVMTALTVWDAFAITENSESFERTMKLTMRMAPMKKEISPG
jgi:hypothetical protein